MRQNPGESKRWTGRRPAVKGSPPQEMPLTPAPFEFRQLLDAAPEAMIVVDQDGMVTALNCEAERILGWTEEGLLGQPMTRFIPSRFQGFPRLDLEPREASSTNGATTHCFARRQNSSEFPVEMTRCRLGQVHSLVTLRDRTEWRHTQEIRSRNNELAGDTLESIGDSVITSDATGRITYLNPVAEHLTGWSVEEALGQSLDVVLPLVSEVSRLPVPNTAARCLKEGRSVDLEEGVVLLRRDGTEIPIGDSAAPVRDRNGGIIGVVMVLQDESEKRRVGHQLSHEASHDVLTGLLNRREFERRLRRVIGDFTVAASEHALLYLDLDRFKLINDICGHEAGDAVLQGLGPLLSRHLRKRDSLARLGGDEFGVLLENCPLLEAERIAESLRVEVEGYRFEWAGQAFSIGVSIGLFPVSRDNGGVDAVLRAADAACYKAKESGGNRVRLEWASRDAARASHSTAGPYLLLNRAIKENLFQLYAQSIVSLQPESLARRRVEILLRLRDDRLRMRSAAEFLPQAERYQLMPAIDEWVVRETIATLGRWQADHPDAQLPICSINLSPSSLVNDRLVPSLERELNKSGVAAEGLCFEIAESAALANLPQAVRFFSAIRGIGCGTAVDDCGSSVASMTYLKSLPVTFLKVGGQLVREVVDDPMFGSIISAVNQIGLSMGVATVAKQVGSADVLNKVRALGIGYAQGCALVPPIPLTDSEGRMSMPGLRRSA